MTLAAEAALARSRAVLIAAVSAVLLLLGTLLVTVPSPVTAADAPCDAGARFFGSAGEGTVFAEGDTWQGGTFTSIGLDGVMTVEEENDELIGTFVPSQAYTATIEFDRTIRITAVLWWDNDPKSGEAGWSVNGVSGPSTGEDGLVCTAVDITTDTVEIDAGGDSGGLDLWFEEVAAETATPTPTPAAETATPTATPAEEVGTVRIMKHVCPEEIQTQADFDALGSFVDKVLTCGVITLPGDEGPAGALDAGDAFFGSLVAGGTAEFDFMLSDAAGDVSLAADGAFAAAALCETDLGLDVDGSGTVDADVCVEVSHYAHADVQLGSVTVTESEPPAGHRFGALELTPDSGDAAAVVDVDADTGTIVLDTSSDADVMLHVYNFANVSAPTPSPTPEQEGEGATPTPTPEQEQQGGRGTPAPTVPDTALGGEFAPSNATIVFASFVLVALAGLVGLQLATRGRRR